MSNEEEDENNYNFNRIREYFHDEILNYAINNYRDDHVNLDSEIIGENLFLLDDVNEVINNIFENDLERTLRESFDESLDYLKRSDDNAVEFNIFKYGKLNNEGKRYSKCIICLEEFKPDSEVTLTECNHIFHHDCIKEWVRYKKECAICRNEIKIK